jgi:molybdopterin/thiamine biosynthesis adenylyltransferase
MQEDRYSRQKVLAGIGTKGQERLAAARVLVIGAGGLGSPVLLYLAGAGVGHLTIIDDDRVELTNLHRQPLFTMDDLGQPKASAARQQLLARNPDIVVEPFVTRLTPKNIQQSVEKADIIVDAADSLAVTYQLSAACFALDKPLISAAVLEQRGYVGGFCGGAPSYRAVFSDMPTQIGSCAANGVLGPVVGVIGAIQAQWVIQTILGHQPSPLGRLFSLDLTTMHSGGFRFEDVPEPVEPDLPYIMPSAIAPDDWVIELRGVEEAPEPIVPAAHRISPANLATHHPLKDRRIVLCCQSGIRAHRAGRFFQQQLFDNITLVAASDRE